MIYRFFATAMAAGLLAAVLVSGIESLTTTPMILVAETFESPATITEHVQTPTGAQDHAALSDSSGNLQAENAKPWTPANGLERFLYTLVANAVVGIAFALLLVVGLSMGDHKVNQSKGILLALVGFAGFTLAPILGLPPELPGIPAADLQLRQVWWIATVILSLGGIYCIFSTESKSLKILGVILLLAPHVWGAPISASHESLVPAALSAQFTASSITISALFWVLIGYFAPIFFMHFKGKEA